MKQHYRIGQVVPSSNVTMETEIPLILGRRQTVLPETFSFHASRMRMKKVTREELAAMDASAGRCVQELTDARVDIIGYACLVAIMSMGAGYHRQSEAQLGEVARANDAPTPIVTSAGALIQGLRALGARRVSIITPYMKPLTRLVAAYLEEEGIEVVDALSLEIEDNLAVGARDPLALVDLSRNVRTTGIDVLVASACVQMPSLAALDPIERCTGIPTVSAASCTAFAMLSALGLDPVAPGFGAILAPTRPLALEEPAP
ncbi:maleate cis-trans isomerase family protein [Paraburkholderia oxyphila]|uniref:maleate cis-trans isomerase family protein n=1 Tax=Paraburkholderia oxyphila TaxID=614212 RepID=UPI0005B7F933